MKNTLLRQETGDWLELYLDGTGRWRWRVSALNGRIIASSSQGYLTKWGAKKNARRCGWKV